MGCKEKSDAGINMLLNLFTRWSGYYSQACSLNDLPLE
jgi:hypothetical protein